MHTHLVLGRVVIPARDLYFDLYHAVWIANYLIALVLLVLVSVIGMWLLRKRKPDTTSAM